MTQDRINKAKALAEAHGGKSGKIILDLVAEIERLRRLTLRTGMHPVGNLEAWPYHPHLGKPLCDLDDDFLRDWAAQRSRRVLMHDCVVGIIALRDLRLCELIAKHLKTNGQPDIKTETCPET
jgi:hypothetical protein